MNFKVILSSTVLTEGTFTCKNVPFPADLTGIPHYVGHPATKALLDALGAEKSPESLFGGLEVGESYLAVPLATSPRADGWTKDTAIDDITALQAKLITRIA